MKKFLITIIVVLLVVCSYLVYANLTYEFDYDTGVKQEEVVSPTGNYTAQVFYQSYGGAAGGVNVYVNVIFHSENNMERTVYYSDAKSSFRIQWVGEDKLSVTNVGSGENRSIVLTIGKDIYDETGKACSKYVILKNYSCYSKKSS